MANTSRPKGLVPVRHLDGSPWNGQTMPFLHSSADAVAIYIGDPVKISGTSGAAGVVVGGMDVEGMATVARDTSGTTGAATIGVAVGFSVDPTNLMKSYCAASEYRVVHVVCDPTVIYQIEEDALTTPIAQASVGLNVALSTTAGSTATGLSGMTLDSDSVNTTATLPLKIIGLAKRPDNALNTGGAGTDPATFEVIFNTGGFTANSIGF